MEKPPRVTQFISLKELADASQGAQIPPVCDRILEGHLRVHRPFLCVSILEGHLRVHRSLLCVTEY